MAAAAVSNSNNSDGGIAAIIDTGTEQRGSNPPRQLSSTEEAVPDGKPHQPKRKRKPRRPKKAKYAPYSAKHFLGRPKINAPANTTQFIFEDKELEQIVSSGCESVAHVNYETSSCSEQDDTATSSTSLNDRLSVDDGDYEQCVSNDSETFLNNEFHRLYDDLRSEMLRSQSADELTSKCMDLETAIHNLRYLLQKEYAKRHKVDEIMHLRQQNKELLEENQKLKTQLSSCFKHNASVTDASVNLVEQYTVVNNTSSST